jgi:hypothetical protein
MMSTNRLSEGPEDGFPGEGGKKTTYVVRRKAKRE